MGERPRLFHERVELEERQQRGDPIAFDDIPETTRSKMAHWIIGDILADDEERCERALYRLQRAVGTLPGKGRTWGVVLQDIVRTAKATHVWSLVEAAVSVAVKHAMDYGDGYSPDEKLKRLGGRIRQFNVFLGDEFIGYRLIFNEGKSPQFLVRRIDSELLHREVVDRTFQIIRAPEFVAADEHYHQAWKHYSKSDYPDAITNAGKALESALKVLLANMDKTIRTDNLSASDVFRELFNRDFLPETIRPAIKQLRVIYQDAVPPIRNDSTHGDVEPFKPDASLTLLVLNLVGSLIVFAVQAHSSPR